MTRRPSGSNPSAVLGRSSEWGVLSASPAAVIQVDPGPEDTPKIQGLFRAYAQSLSVDLCFQDFEREVSLLPGRYSPPGGALLLATMDAQAAGCCALRPLEGSDYANAAEMKRLWVQPDFRGRGIGRQLAERALSHALSLGYEHVLLDTLDDMESARALYADLGFQEVAPYYYNPIPGAHYLCARLR